MKTIQTIKTIKTAFKQNKWLFIKFFASLVVSVVLISVLMVGSSAGNPDAGTETEIIAEAPSPDSSALNDLIGVDASQPLEIVLLITILAVAPSILLMMTSFTRIIIVFGFLRNASKKGRAKIPWQSEKTQPASHYSSSF